MKVKNYIVIFAILALVVALLVIFKKEVWAYINKKLFGKFKKKEKSKAKIEKKAEDKKEKKPTYTVDDFVPAKIEEDTARDSSVEMLLGIDEFGLNETKNDFSFDSMPKLTDEDKKRLSDFFGSDESAFKRVQNNTSSPKSISRQIKDLSPEMKVLLLDNVLKKRDDV